MEVTDWLGRIGLPQYAKAFADNEIDAGVLQQLTAEDLKELGVSLLGHRRKLLTAIEALRSHAEPSSRATAGEELASPDAMAGLSPERRHLTVLFCDLVGSTALAARLDPEDLRDVIRRYHAVVADTVRSQQGFVAQFLGDGALVYFGFPVAHEDDAERAVRAPPLCFVRPHEPLKWTGSSCRYARGWQRDSLWPAIGRKARKLLTNSK
jgi:hypothetical protein